MVYEGIEGLIKLCDRHNGRLSERIEDKYYCPFVRELKHECPYQNLKEVYVRAGSKYYKCDKKNDK